MRQTFFLFVAGMVVVALVGGAIYLFIRSIITYISDLRTDRELREFAKEYQEFKRAKAAAANDQPQAVSTPMNEEAKDEVIGAAVDEVTGTTQFDVR